MPVVTDESRERRRTIRAWLLLSALLLLTSLATLLPSAIYMNKGVRLKVGKHELRMGRTIPFPDAGVFHAQPTKWQPDLGRTIRSGGITLGSWHYLVSCSIEEPQPPGVPMDRFILW